MKAVDLYISTYADEAKIELTEEAFTPYSGLIAFPDFFKKTRKLEKLVAICPIKRTCPNAVPIKDMAGRLWYSLITSKIGSKSKQTIIKLSIRGKWSIDLTKGTQRLCRWLRETAPQLDLWFKKEQLLLVELLKKLLCLHEKNLFSLLNCGI